MLMTGWRRCCSPDDSTGGGLSISDADIPEEVSGGTEEGGDPSVGEATEATEAAPASGQPESSPQWPGFRTYVREKFGRDLGSKYKDDDEAINGLLHAASLVGQRNQEAELGRQFAPYQAEFVKYLQERQQPAARVREQEQPKNWWSPPPADESWNKWIIRDPDGNKTLRDDTPLEVKKAIGDYQAYIEQWDYKLRTNPVEALKGAFEQLKEETRREVFNEFQQQQTQQYQAAVSNAFVNQNADWIYAKTTDGNYVRDLNGGFQFTPQGAQFAQACIQLTEAGIQDQQKIIDLAVKMVQAQQAPVANAPKTTPARSAHPGMSAGRQPASGSVPGQGRNNPGTSGQTIREKLLQAMSDMPDDNSMMM